jgi:hypothetical protein
MIFAAKMLFLGVTLFAWVEVGGVIYHFCRHHAMDTSVVFAVMATAVGCLGNVTNWKYLRQRKRDDVIVFRPSNGQANK